MKHPYLDVLIVGAGLSGIGAACHLKEKCPNVRFGIVERRKRIGGTWDLFRYPGIRSDSDMFTLGYNFRPWTDTKMLADGPSIRRYIDDTAREYDVKRRIQFGLKVISQSWQAKKNTGSSKPSTKQPMKSTSSAPALYSIAPDTTNTTPATHRRFRGSTNSAVT